MVVVHNGICQNKTKNSFDPFLQNELKKDTCMIGKYEFIGITTKKDIIQLNALIITNVIVLP